MALVTIGTVFSQYRVSMIADQFIVGFHGDGFYDSSNTDLRVTVIIINHLISNNYITFNKSCR